MIKTIERQISEYLNWCEFIAGMTEQTTSSKSYILYRFARQTGVLDIFDLDFYTFSNWKLGMMTGTLTGKKHSSATVNVRIKTLRSFLKWATDFYDKKLKIKPVMISKVREMDFGKDYTFYTEGQVKYVSANSPQLENIMINLFFESGLRISEFRNIKVGDIDFSEGKISVLGKGRKMGTVYFSFRTGLKIRSYIEASNLSSCDYLWKSPASDAGMPFTVKTIRKKLKKCFEENGFYNFYPHQLRHSFATNLAEKGASIYEIQHLLRHEDIRTTQIYLHHLQNRVGDVYRRIFNEEIYYIKPPINEKSYA